jgi:hypothetical protein
LCKFFEQKNVKVSFHGFLRFPGSQAKKYKVPKNYLPIKESVDEADGNSFNKNLPRETKFSGEYSSLIWLGANFSVGSKILLKNWPREYLNECSPPRSKL